MGLGVLERCLNFIITAQKKKMEVFYSLEEDVNNLHFKRSVWQLGAFEYPVEGLVPENPLADTRPMAGAGNCAHWTPGLSPTPHGCYTCELHDALADPGCRWAKGERPGRD